MAQACPDSSRSGLRQRSTGLGPPAGSSQPVHACAGPASSAPRRGQPLNAHAGGRPSRLRPSSRRLRSSSLRVPGAARRPPAAGAGTDLPGVCAAPRRVAPGPATARSFWSEHASCLHPWAVTGLHEEFRELNEKLLVTGVRDGSPSRPAQQTGGFRLLCQLQRRHTEPLPSRISQEVDTRPHGRTPDAPQ